MVILLTEVMLTCDLGNSFWEVLTVGRYDFIGPGQII